MGSQEKVPDGWIKVKSKTRPDKYYFYHIEKKISVWKLSDCNDESKINNIKNSLSKTPNKSPKKESKLSNQSINIGKSNIADERLKKLQKTLKEEARRGIIENKKVKPAKEIKIREVGREKKESVLKLTDEFKVNNAKNPKIPKKSPKKESKPVNIPIVGKRSNKANERLRKLQKTLGDEAKSGIKENDKIKAAKETKLKEIARVNRLENGTNSTISQTKLTPQVSIETINKSFVPVQNCTTQSTIEDEESFKMEIDEQLDKSTDSLKDYEEPMDWEDIDEKLIVQEVHNVRTKNNKEHSSIYAANREANRVFKDNFYIIVDTNVLLSNLQFVKEIKSKLFKDIGRAHIYLPYVVLCELDRLKKGDENIARLARTAISYIDECFKNKDEFLLGQNAIESSRELIEIDTGDDYIINCALQMKEHSSKIIVLSNDKNLRNKAFVNGFEVFSSDTLNFADYNVSNSIKFE